MREFNGENMMGKCKKRIIKGMCLIETVVDRKKVKDGSRKNLSLQRRENKGCNDCEKVRERK